MTRSEADEMCEAFDDDRVAVVNKTIDRFFHRNQLTHNFAAFCHNVIILAMPLLLLLSVLLFSPTDIDWTKAQSEAVQLLQELIRIDTTNPPGNELATARHIQKVLDADGIETRILDVAPGRANLYARIKGDGSKRPLILLSHTDVVMADTARWTIP